jgi:hypothetical protein
MRTRLAISGTVFLALLGILYLEQWLAIWFPVLPSNTFLVTALVGGAAWSFTLPHPRQERKRREALALLSKAKENMVPAANAATGLFFPKESEETLAEKRP